MFSPVDPSATQARSDSIRILIVDDHPVIIEALGEALDAASDMTLCGTATTYAEGIRAIEGERPDVAVIDISLSDGHGLELVRLVQAQVPDVRMLVFSMYDEAIYAERAIRGGAFGYLMKSESLDMVKETIRRVARGETVVSGAVTSRILNRIGQGEVSAAKGPVEALTDRELEVFQMLGQGRSVEDVQEVLSLTRKTIETYRRRAKEKLGVDTVAELLQYAVQWTHAQSACDDTRRTERIPRREADVAEG